MTTPPRKKLPVRKPEMSPQKGLMKKDELEGAVKGLRDMEEVHYGGEGPHWAVVPMKKEICFRNIIMR